MAVAMYYTWLAQGKPLEPANPVREIVDRFKAKFPGAGPFSWHANDEHYQANKPLDHTPYSTDGYKTNPSPYPVVFATDIMNQPSKGVECQKLFNYWIGEARAGRMPWLKYLIWQAKIYDVRHGWVAQTSSEHFDHIHISTRTDYRNASLGTWSLFPGGGGVPNVALEGIDKAQVNNSEHYLQSVVGMTTEATGISNINSTNLVVPNKLTAILNEILAKLNALAAPEPAPVDLDAVRMIVREELDKTHLSD